MLTKHSSYACPFSLPAVISATSARFFMVDLLLGPNQHQTCLIQMSQVRKPRGFIFKFHTRIHDCQGVTCRGQGCMPGAPGTWFLANSPKIWHFKYFNIKHGSLSQSSNERTTKFFYTDYNNSPPPLPSWSLWKSPVIQINKSVSRKNRILIPWLTRWGVQECWLGSGSLKTF